MYSIILLFHTLLAVSIVILVLLQQGRGGVGALSGGAPSESFFGSRGSFSLTMKITAGCVALFFITSMGLAMVSKQEFGSDISSSVIREQQRQQEELQQQQEQGVQLPSLEEQQQELEQQQGTELPVFDEQTQQPEVQLPSFDEQTQDPEVQLPSFDEQTQEPDAQLPSFDEQP